MDENLNLMFLVGAGQSHNFAPTDQLDRVPNPLHTLLHTGIKSLIYIGFLA